jgi:CheY-like chemotaxis protein/HPt (histidine-containing phosphotransfer) domain-containing protein
MNASAAHPALPPRLLLLEDDPVSAAFLTAALDALPARVTHAATLAEARIVAEGCDLWLFDAHLPDGDGATLLAELRFRGLRTPALAHTAEARRELLDVLIDAGFAEVLQKPLTMAQLQAAVRRALGDAASATAKHEATRGDPHRCAKSPVWDDAAALRALNGRRDHVAAMRGLFLQELPPVATRVTEAAARDDTDALRGELHRLQASCGFVGAARLAAAVDALRDAPHDPAALAQFDGAAQDTLSWGTLSSPTVLSAD